MPVVYHLAPPRMIGGALYPLNRLREIDPAIYAQHARKYAGRQETAARILPILNCLWGDVLFFSTTHPDAIRQGYLSAGARWTPQKWLEINATAAGFSAENTVIYMPDMRRGKGDFTLRPEQFSPYDPNKLAVIHTLPDDTLRYYREAADKGAAIMAWRGLPHILFHGSVALDDAVTLEI